MEERKVENFSLCLKQEKKTNRKIHTNKLTNKQQESTSLYYQRNNPYHSSSLKPSKASFCIRTLYMFLKSCYDHKTVRKESSKISANYLRYLAKKMDLWSMCSCSCASISILVSHLLLNQWHIS